MFINSLNAIIIKSIKVINFIFGVIAGFILEVIIGFVLRAIENFVFGTIYLLCDWSRKYLL